MWRELCYRTDARTVWLIDLLDSEYNTLYNATREELESALKSLNPARVNAIEGEFALWTLVESEQQIFVCARTLGVPARLAFQPLPSLPNGHERSRIFIAHSIREIREAWCESIPDDIDVREIGQFDPDYTEMLPAFYLLRLRPWALKDRDEAYEWFLPTPEHARPPEEEQLPCDDYELMGRAYVQAALSEIEKILLKLIPSEAAIGLAFSGGLDSGMIALLLIEALRKTGRSNPLILLTLTVDGKGQDVVNAEKFIQQCLPSHKDCWIKIEYRSSDLDIDKLLWETACIIEDYGIRDLEAAMAMHILLKETRRQYPGLKFLFTGEGGNEAFQDYPLADPGYRRISLSHILEDPHLFYLGYKRGMVPVSPTRSAGLSRGYVRTFNIARHFGFKVFSPLISRRVVEVAQKFPIPRLVRNPEDLKKLRAEVIPAGIKAELNIEMPAFDKVRFQEGVAEKQIFRVEQSQREEIKTRLKRELSLTPKT